MHAFVPTLGLAQVAGLANDLGEILGREVKTAAANEATDMLEAFG